MNDVHISYDDLCACRRKVHEIESLEERIARLRSALEGGAAALSQTPKATPKENDVFGARIAQLIDMERQLVERVAEREFQLRTVDKWLEALPHADSTVIRLRYVDGLPWRKVAKKVNYTPDSCFKINRRVLRSVQ